MSRCVSHCGWSARQAARLADVERLLGGLMATARRLLPSASGVLYACAAGAQLAEAETEERARLDREAMGAERAARVVEQHERLAGAAPFVHDGL